MTARIRPVFNIFTLCALLLSLLGSAVVVTPARAAGIVVNSNADTIANDGACTLREAIINANNDNTSGSTDCAAGAGPDTITFASNYTITLVGSQLPAIATVITINGNGAANTIIQANASAYIATYRVFEVSNTGNLTLDGLTVRNGRCIGSCTANTGSGGGIHNAGTLAVSNAIFSGNYADDSGGGIFNFAGSPTITNVTFSGNSATNGGGMLNYGSNPVLTNVTFSGNFANYGSGIYNYGSNNPILTDVTFSGNIAAVGGGMYNEGSNPKLTNVIFSGNTSSYGSGIYNLNGNMTLTNGTFSNNSASIEGGGMFNRSTSPTLANVTFSGNSATDRGGGMFNDDNSNPKLSNVTFSGNSSINGGGGMHNVNNSNPTLKNVIIANSTSGGDCINDASTLNAASTNNLIEDAAKACGLLDGDNGNIIGSDPLLGTLANNGGPTQTLALLPGSRAVDAGDAATCAAVPVSGLDQRGVTRPQGAGCDIGAFELVPPPAITSAVYDASAGTLTVTGSDLLANGSGSDIIANKFTLTGEGGVTYTLTDTANVELATATTFVFNLSASDNATVRMILNKNGTTSTGGTTYNLAAADDWASGATASDNIADPVNILTVVNVSVPNIQFATYNASTGLLTVSGSRMLAFNGANNDINVSKLTVSGEGNASHTLTSGNVELTSSTSFSVTLNSADRDALRQILNKDGTSANDGTLYNLTAADDWNNGADPTLFIADLTNGVTVSDVVPPTLLVTKTDSVDPVVAGEAMMYTVTVQNTGTPNYDANNVRLTDQLPSGFTVTNVQPSQGSCSPVSGGVLSCTLGTIASGASANVVITGNFPSTTVNGTITNNIAYVTSAEGNNGNDGDDTPADNDDARAEEPTTILRQSDTSITKTVDKNPVNEGDTITFNLAVANNGFSQASNVVVTDNIPAGLTFVSFAPNTQPCVYAAPTLTCTFPTLDVGETQNISITVTVDSGAASLTPITNMAIVTAVEPEADNLNNSADVNVLVGAPTVISQTLLANYTGTGPNSFTVTFNEEVNNPAGNIDSDDVTNPANFLLIEKGVNGLADTISCAGGVQIDDTQINVASVTYINPTAIVTLSAPLPVGNYRLFVCGTTSIVDLSLTPLNGGLSDYIFDFTVTAAPVEEEENGMQTIASSLPKTGFAPHRVTTLPPQPATLEYAKVGDIVLEIPSLNVKSTIVGVPQSNGEWDVTWLGNNIGWLNGTAFPTWKGNSVLTAHVVNASGLEGPFAALKQVKYGDQIIVHMGGAQYIYEVRNSRLARPYSTSFAFESKQDASYLTLITCQIYNPLNESYLFRRVVRAVLVEVK